MTLSELLSQEPYKLLSQLLVGLVIALAATWLAVVLALARFKKEKLWERRLATYADLIDALSEMRRILLVWVRREEEGAPDNEEYEKELRERYHRAKLKFETTAGIARVLLDDAIPIIKRVEDELESSRGKYATFYESVDSGAHTVHVALKEIQIIARKHLHLKPLQT